MEKLNIFDFGVEDNHYDYKKVFSKKDYPIRLFEAFAGIGCQAMAFNRREFPYISVGISEIDKYAIKSYNAIHGKTKNYGDICKMDSIPPCDIFTWSFPCTDLSKAGKQKGMIKNKTKQDIDKSVFLKKYSYDFFVGMAVGLSQEDIYAQIAEYKNAEKPFYIIEGQHIELGIPPLEWEKQLPEKMRPEVIKILQNRLLELEEKEGTRSGLVYEVLRLLHVTEEKPTVLIMENVVDLVQVKFMAEFYEIQKEIESLGYKNFTQTINAKHQNVAQNRDRVFMVSILRTETNPDPHYEFPPRVPLEYRLKDYLEENVDEKYYLSDKAIKGIKNSTFNTTKSRIQSDDEPCDTLCARDYKDPKCVVDEVKVIRYGHGYNKGGEIRNDISPTIDGAIGARYTAAIVEPKIIEEPTAGIFQPKDRDYNKKGKEREEQFEPRTDGVSNSVLTHSIKNCIAIPEATQKGYAEAQEGDSINLSQPNSKTRRGRVGKGVAQTLLTGQEQAVIMGGQDETERITKEILSILWQGIRAQEIWQEQIRRFKDISEKEILRQIMYEKSVFGRTKEETNIQQFSYNGEIKSEFIQYANEMRNMWINAEYRCSPQRWGLSKQFIRQFDDFVSQLPQQTAQEQEEMYYLWCANKRFGILQQALYQIQETWKSINQKHTDLRIRKLTERECGRLMGVSDEDITKMSKVVSRSQMYKQFGNGIVVDVFAGILEGLIERVDKN